MPKGKSGSGSHLVEVTPITKALAPSTLSYFSALKISPGTLVKAPLRKGSSPAIVLSSRDVKSAKTEIRRAGFFLKKIGKKDIFEAGFSPHVMVALKETALYYATSVGALLSSLLPKVMVDEPEIFLQLATSKKKRSKEHVRETLLLQMENEERFGQYRALVRQSFARGASLMFVVPTHLDIEKVRSELSHGIAEFVFVWTLNLKKSEIKKVWSKALDEKHPVLFITTPAGIFFNRPDLDTIVIDRENSRAYRSMTRPFVHFKVLVEKLAKISDKQLVLGDSVLSLETLWREKNSEYSENSLIRWRLPASPTTLVDASTKQNDKGRFEIFSPELKALTSKAIEERQSIFLFGARKGLAPTTVCGDCGTVLPCLNCGAPVVLHRIGEATHYICHACRSRRESATTCGFCGSWKLVPLGIGTQEIAREARGLFPLQPILILDKDHATTDKQAQVVAKEFKERGGILVGTELAFFHLANVPYSALVSVDALFSVPDFGISERIFYLVSRLREMTKIESLVQTRNIGKQILAWSAQGDIIDFYQSEIAEREMLLYPPFSIFVKITLPKKNLMDEMARLKIRFERWHPDTFKDSIVMRIPKASWPDVELSRELALLPPQFSIKVDPESIL